MHLFINRFHVFLYGFIVLFRVFNTQVCLLLVIQKNWLKEEKDRFEVIGGDYEEKRNYKIRYINVFRKLDFQQRVRKPRIFLFFMISISSEMSFFRSRENGILSVYVENN